MIVCQRCNKENQDHFQRCLGCGAETKPSSHKLYKHSESSKPPAEPAAWQAAQGSVRSLTVQMAVKCRHCAAPVPLNGPSQSAHCSACLKDSPLPQLAKELVFAEMFQHGSNYTTHIFSSPDPQCFKCEATISVAQYLPFVGATTTVPCPSCGTGCPTFPAPAWLKAQLPMALQVFGAAPETANAQAGLAIPLDDEPKPIAMACPSCGGGLTITARAERTTTCGYCSANIFLPDELWKRLHPVRTMGRWTLTYVGCLKTSETLAEEADDRADEQRCDAEAQRKRKREDHEWREDRKREKRKERKALIVVGLFFMVFIVGMIVFLTRLSRNM